MPGLLLLCVRSERKGSRLQPEDRGCFPERGFTLIEVLATVTVFILISGSIFSLYFYSIKAYRESTARLDLQQNVRVGLDFITRDLRYATRVELVSPREIKYRLPGAAANYIIKQRNSEIVYLINVTEEKIVYNIGTLTFKQDAELQILYIEIQGVDGSYNYALRSAIYLQNINEGYQL